MDIEQVEDSQPSSDLQGLTVGKSQKAASLLGSGHFDGCNRGVAPRGGDDHPSGNGQTVWPRAISDSPEDRQEPPPGAVFAKVEIREVWPPGLGPPDDNIFDL
jgi:hypothetical protein